MDEKERKVAKDALQNCEWFNDLVNGSSSDFEEISFKVGREHFVAGERGAFEFRFAVSKTHVPEDERKLICALFAGNFATNTVGMAHGGAVAAVLDYVAAVTGFLILKDPTAASMTASLNVRFKKPTPLQKVLKVESSGDFSKRTATVKVTIIDLEANLECADCEAALVSRSREKSKSKESTSAPAKL